MSEATLVEISAKRIEFYSDHDEAAFFEWLQKIPCVSAAEGSGDAIVIQVLDDPSEEAGLRELLALFKRYEIDVKQVLALRMAQHAWARNPDAFWARQAP